MIFWLFLAASIVFAWLAYDAWSLSGSDSDESYSLTAAGLGQDSTGVPLDKLEKLKRSSASMRLGLGDSRAAVWLWTVLSLGCAAAAASGIFA